MIMRFFLTIFCAVGLSSSAVWAVQAQTANTETHAEEQNETMRDTLVRMRIKREEDEHKKLLEKATKIKDLAQELTKDVHGQRLVRTSEKKLKEIEKNARNIRTESGGGSDEPLEQTPATLDEAVRQLQETSGRLNDKITKTSRHVVSVSVVNEATELIQLIKLLRGYLN
jgi:hypothetical protein